MAFPGSREDNKLSLALYSGAADMDNTSLTLRLRGKLYVSFLLFGEGWNRGVKAPPAEQHS